MRKSTMAVRGLLLSLYVLLIFRYLGDGFRYNTALERNIRRSSIVLGTSSMWKPRISANFLAGPNSANCGISMRSRRRRRHLPSWLSKPVLLELYLFNCILLLSNDISLNPGPTKKLSSAKKCLYCSKTIKATHL